MYISSYKYSDKQIKLIHIHRTNILYLYNIFKVVRSRFLLVKTEPIRSVKI